MRPPLPHVVQGGICSQLALVDWACPSVQSQQVLRASPGGGLPQHALSPNLMLQLPGLLQEAPCRSPPPRCMQCNTPPSWGSPPQTVPGRGASAGAPTVPSPAWGGQRGVCACVQGSLPGRGGLRLRGGLLPPPPAAWERWGERRGSCLCLSHSLPSPERRAQISLLRMSRGAPFLLS